MLNNLKTKILGSKLLELHPQPLVWNEITVEADSLLQFSDKLGLGGQVEPSLAEALNKVAVSCKTLVEEFDLTRIQSISSSKSFMYWNSNVPSCENIDAWADIFWEDENIGFTTQDDFEQNLKHVEREFKGHFYYSPWHDRYYATNSGGSHHFVALVKQAKRQGLDLLKPVELTIFGLDHKPLEDLQATYHMCLVHNKSVKHDNLQFTHDLLGIDLEHEWIDVRGGKNPVGLLFVKKKQPGFSEFEINTWVSSNISNGNIIDFYQFCKKYPLPR